MKAQVKFNSANISLTVLIVYILIHYAGIAFATSSDSLDQRRVTGLIETNCWFTADPDWPPSKCYFMQVPENHLQPKANIIAYPVVRFNSNTDKAPVLHLGAGGPGAAMYLDSTASVRSLLQEHDDLSINQGRDLWLIDPRGAGLAKPLLNCTTYIENAQLRLQQNLPMDQDWQHTNKDYLQCIEQFLSQGIDLAFYNSMAVAHDIEMMRQVAGIERWVLIGVSHGAIYAQLVAMIYPTSVESMILDSATFPNLKMHHNYTARTMAPYQALYNYCQFKPDCKIGLKNMQQRIQSLYKALNQDPIHMTIDHPYQSGSIEVVLNGNRLMSSLLIATYGTAIFTDLPRIILELEVGENHTVRPYLESYIAFELEPDFSIISFATHYCYEQKAFIDFEKIRRAIKQLPDGYIKDSAYLSMEWPDHCKTMGVAPGQHRLTQKTQTDIPTLFLHGQMDSITRLGDVQSQLGGFTNNRLVTFPLSHGVLAASECAEHIAALFVADNTIGNNHLKCN